MNKSHYNEYKYRTKRNIATNEVSKAKQSFEQKMAKECHKNPKAETDIEKAEILNSFLRSVYNDEDTGELPEAETTAQTYNI